MQHFPELCWITERVSYITHIDVLIWIELPAKNRKKNNNFQLDAPAGRLIPASLSSLLAANDDGTQSAQTEERNWAKL